MKLQLLIAFFLLLVNCVTYAQQPLPSDILRQPIVEGHEAAGISLGETGKGFFKKMGGLPQLGGSGDTLRYANIMDKEGKMNLYINVFLENNSVIGVEIMSVPVIGLGHIYKGKTKKGFQFGDSVEKVKALYGRPYKSAESINYAIHWYKKEGIIFQYFYLSEEGVGKWPTSIVILKPGQSIPKQVKEVGGPISEWD